MRLGLLVAGCALALVVATESRGVARAPTKNGNIVFARVDPVLGRTRLYVVEPDGRRLRALTQPGPAQADSQPDWSPDGRRILFRRLDSGQAQIYVVGADGKGLRNLTRASCRSGCVGNEEPAWSPDGRRIAFVRTLGAAPPARPRAVGIFVMNADGTGVRQLTQRKGAYRTEDRSPAWSPDGKRIALMSANTTTRPAGASVIYVINADGTHPRAVHTLPHAWPGAGAPAWSPDGKRILYSTYCWFGNCGQAPVGAQLFTIGVDGKSPRQVTHYGGNALGARWSPDGKRIVFVHNTRNRARRRRLRPQRRRDRPATGYEGARPRRARPRLGPCARG